VSKRWVIGGIVAAFLLLGVGARMMFGPTSEGVSRFQRSRAESLAQKAEEALGQKKWEEAIQYYTEIVEEFPASELQIEGHLGIGNVYFAKKDFLKAKKVYEKIIQEFPNSETARIAQEKLGSVNMAILFSPIMTPQYKKIEVQSGDTLGKLAKAHGTTVDLLMKTNGLDSSLIRPGMKLKAPTTRFSIVVDKSLNHLTLKSGEEIFKVYSIATGKNNSTPVGTFKIINKLVNPVWYTLGAVVPAESPENVLGTRWLGINEPGYGIHGNKDPSSIGQQLTQGCVRMYNHDVEELYTVVPIGTEVTIID